MNKEVFQDIPGVAGREFGFGNEAHNAFSLCRTVTTCSLLFGASLP